MGDCHAGICGSRGLRRPRRPDRLSSGSYMPPVVRAVQIPKPHGLGVRSLGVPTVADRVAQTVVKKYLEPGVEPVFHPDSYGYRPGRSAHGALRVCRERCGNTFG
jgi:RNA-directed DNA polymerase